MPDLNTIDRYEKYLSRNYSKEIVELCANGILSYMKKAWEKTITKIRAAISERLLLKWEEGTKQMKLSHT